MILRTIIVVAAYVLSGAGFMFMALGALGLIANQTGWLPKLIVPVWFFAWVAHVNMSQAWVRNRSVARRWPVWGTAAGVFSLLSPVLTLFENNPGSALDRLEAALITCGVVAVFFLPSILLAGYLVSFHLGLANAGRRSNA